MLFREIADSTKNEKLKSAANANAGRIKFIENDFKQATSVYKLIPQSSTHWLDSSVELAWSQLRDNDPESTIGNLNVLHQQFAKNALLTESYTIKALAYQQICQFGDAINAIKFGDLLYKKSYDWLKEINSNKSTSYYRLIADALRGKSQGPTQAIIELARNKKFLNAQERDVYKRQEKQFIGLAAPITPMYAKFQFLGKKIGHFDVYVAPGFGLMKTVANRFALTMAVGQRYFITTWMFIKLEYKFIHYNDKVDTKEGATAVKNGGPGYYSDSVSDHMFNFGISFLLF